MNTWKEFIDSLGSRGAAILLLVLWSIGLCAVLLYLLRHGDKGDITTTLVATFSAFTGALLTVLSTQGKAQNGNGAPKPPEGEPKP